MIINKRHPPTDFLVLFLVESLPQKLDMTKSHPEGGSVEIV